VQAVPSDERGMADGSCIRDQNKGGWLKMNRQLHRRDDSETGCQAIDLASYLEAANEKLRQALAELTRETAALRQELEKMESRGRGAEAVPCRQASNDDP
jgi:hypothetical protein